MCKFACLLHNPSTADYRKWLAPGACFDLGCRCGPKAVGGEGVVGAIEEGMAAVSRHDIAGIWVAFFSRRCGQDCVLYDLSVSRKPPLPTRGGVSPALRFRDSLLVMT